MITFITYCLEWASLDDNGEVICLYSKVEVKPIKNEKE